jgi:hypothetical protein
MSPKNVFPFACEHACGKELRPEVSSTPGRMEAFPGEEERIVRGLGKNSLRELGLSVVAAYRRPIVRRLSRIALPQRGCP